MSAPNPEAPPPAGGLYDELASLAGAGGESAPESAPASPSAAESLSERLKRAATGKSKDAPAKSPRARAATTEKPSRPGEFVEALVPIYTAVGVAVSFRDHDGICGPVIVENAEKCATAWDELAQKDPNVRRALRTLTRGSAWGSVIAAHGAIFLAIASAHSGGVIPQFVAPTIPEDEDQDEQPAPQPRRAPMTDDARRTRRSAEPTDIPWGEQA